MAYSTDGEVMGDYGKVICGAADTLSGLAGAQCRRGNPIPSTGELSEVVRLCREIFFPDFCGKPIPIGKEALRKHMGDAVERLFRMLTSQVEAGLCFGRDGASSDGGVHSEAERIAAAIVSKLPDIRSVLATDVEATYLGDPAAQSRGEVIGCYPVIKALTCYRVAHELLLLGVPLIPRMITELAHSETGMDIHPGAVIGDNFTIDHGTGVVIGATCIIGRRVKLYQGVTLGAKSFPLDEDGNPVKDIPRHPIIGDDVIVYSNATILGRVTIGDGCVIGANMWVTHDVPPGTKVVK